MDEKILPSNFIARKIKLFRHSTEEKHLKDFRRRQMLMEMRINGIK